MTTRREKGRESASLSHPVNKREGEGGIRSERFVTTRHTLVWCPDDWADTNHNLCAAQLKIRLRSSCGARDQSIRYRCKCHDNRDCMGAMIDLRHHRSNYLIQLPICQTYLCTT